MRDFISNHAKNHGISVTTPLLSAITQECFTVKIIFQVKSQLRLVGSHNTSLGVVAHGALELDWFQIRKCHFLSDLCVFGYIF